MVSVFDNDEDEYIAWVLANQDGFVANVDRDLNFSQYPMVHKATHKLIWSPKIGNFTTGDYTKFCSASLPDLERYAQSKYRRQLTYCATCFRNRA
jgi:hypothetical protein